MLSCTGASSSSRGSASDPRFQVARERAGPRDHRAELFGAVGLQREPGLQRAEAARQIRPEIAGPRRARREPARLPAQIGRRRRKRFAMLLAVAHEQEARVVGHLSPFVEIERDGIGALDAGEPRRELWRQNPERAEGAVDMKPEFSSRHSALQRREIVDRADVDRAGRADHEKWLETRGAIAARPARATHRHRCDDSDRPRSGAARRCRSPRGPLPCAMQPCAAADV